MRKIVVLILSLIVFLQQGFGKQKQKTLLHNTYQVYGLSSDNVKMKGGYFVYENDDLWIVYDFWNAAGSFSMRIHNKTDRQITFDFGKSQLVMPGGLSKPYWTDKVEITSNTYSTQTTRSAAAGSSATVSAAQGAAVSRGSYGLMEAQGASATASSVYGLSRTNGYSSTNTIIDKPLRYVNIPAEGSIEMKGFAIVQDIYATMDFPINNVTRDPIEATFKRNESPVTFANNLSYSFEEGSNNVTTIVSKFWVKKITNMFVSHFNGPKITRKYHDEYGNINEKKEFQYPYAAPNAFFVYRNRSIDKFLAIKIATACICGPPILLYAIIGIGAAIEAIANK